MGLEEQTLEGGELDLPALTSNVQWKENHDKGLRDGDQQPSRDRIRHKLVQNRVRPMMKTA